MKAVRHKRLPRSIRKHIRRQKAQLRRQLSAAEASRAIDQLVRRLRHDAGPPAEQRPQKDAEQTR